MCKVLNVTRSGYYAWRNRPLSQREMANQRLVKQISAIHQDSYETYGSPRVFHALLALGVKCSKNRVARLMRYYGIRAKQTRRHKVTTKRNKAHPVAPNLLQRDFTAERPNRKWLADILTSLRQKAGSTLHPSWTFTAGESSVGRCRNG
jgi:transposase InsO family protein